MAKNLKNENEIICYFDGACRPFNPGGWIGYGWVILEKNKVLCSKSGYKEKNKSNSNNVAEYMALNDLLAFLLNDGLQYDPIRIFGDSLLVVNQCNGYWNILGGKYAEQAYQCEELLKNFTNIKIRWVPREQNTLADAESSRELDRLGVEKYDFVKAKKKHAKIIMY